jgi:pSer/pThr/pTyr-binding forkhead associated (FHA) protein
MRTRLLAKNPIDRKTREFTLTRADVTVGSEPGNTFQLQHETVSRRQAVITLSSTAHEVRDLKSTNGTFVHERRIECPTALKNGDRIRFGVVTFVYEGEAPKSRRVGTVSTLEGLVILLALWFGLTYYFLKWQSYDGTGVIPHRENVRSTVLVRTRSQPGAKKIENPKPAQAMPVTLSSAPTSPAARRDDWL